MTQENINWLTRRFNITADELEGFHSGICYSKLWVKTEEAAKRASAKIKAEGGTVNGGWFDGMALGGITKDGECWEVMT